MNNREEFINAGVKRHYNELEKYIKEHELGCKIFGVFLQGSQNYFLDEYSEKYTSDIDTKAIVIPSANDLINGRDYSFKITLDNNEQIDVKDLRTMISMFRKQNPTYLEILFTDYKIVNKKYDRWFNSLVAGREDIVKLDRMTFAKSTCGSALQKFKSMTHVSPHSAEKIEKFGYDPKELCHLVRYYQMLLRYIENDRSNNNDFMRCLVPSDENEQKYLMAIKRGEKYDKDTAIRFAESINRDIKDLTDSYCKEEPKKKPIIDTFLTDLLEATIRDSLRSELKI